MTLGVGIASTFVLMRFLSWRRENSHQYCKLAPRLVYFDLFTLFQVISFYELGSVRRFLLKQFLRQFEFLQAVLYKKIKSIIIVLFNIQNFVIHGDFFIIIKKNELDFMLERSFLCHFLSFGVQCVYLVFILQVRGCKCTNLCQLDSWSIRTTCLLLLFCTLWGWFPTKSAKEKSWKYWGKQ